MRHIQFGIVLAMMFITTGCSTLKSTLIGSAADTTTQAFFEDLQRTHRDAAYGLFAKGLSNVVAFDQFNQLMDTIQNQWGRIQSVQTAEMPFHERVGESNFIPLDVKKEDIKRYIYEVQFDNAQVNWDLTLAKQDGQYRIIWMSLWGSTNYFTPEIREKIEGLFQKEQ